MKDILIIHGIPIEIVNEISILYKNTRSMETSPDSNIPFFDITNGVLQGDTLAPFLFIIYLEYILKKSMDSNSHIGFTFMKEKARDTQL